MEHPYHSRANKNQKLITLVCCTWLELDTIRRNPSLSGNVWKNRREKVRHPSSPPLIHRTTRALRDCSNGYPRPNKNSINIVALNQHLPADLLYCSTDLLFSVHYVCLFSSRSLLFLSTVDFFFGGKTRPSH